MKRDTKEHILVYTAHRQQCGKVQGWDKGWRWAKGEMGTSARESTIMLKIVTLIRP